MTFSALSAITQKSRFMPRNRSVASASLPAILGPSGPNRRIQELDKQNGARGSRGLVAFDPELLLKKLGSGKTGQDYRDKPSIVSEGDPADAVFYIQKGKVKI